MILILVCNTNNQTQSLGLKGRCHNSYLMITRANIHFFHPKNFSKENIKESVESFADNEKFTSSDKSVNKKRNIFCGKFEQFAKSELELKYSGISEPGAAYLIEYRWQHRRRARKLKIGFQLEFR